jgi:hypothetical protein
MISIPTSTIGMVTTPRTFRQLADISCPSCSSVHLHTASRQ